MKSKIKVVGLTVLILALSGCGSLTSKSIDVEFVTNDAVYEVGYGLTIADAQKVTISDLSAEENASGFKINGIASNENPFPVEVLAHFSCLDSSGVQIAETPIYTSIPANGAAKIDSNVFNHEMPTKVTITEISVDTD